MFKKKKTVKKNVSYAIYAWVAFFILITVFFSWVNNADKIEEDYSNYSAKIDEAVLQIALSEANKPIYADEYNQNDVNQNYREEARLIEKEVPLPKPNNSNIEDNIPTVTIEGTNNLGPQVIVVKDHFTDDSEIYNTPNDIDKDNFTIIGADDRQKEFSLPFKGKKKKIALIIGGFGLNDTSLDMARNFLDKKILIGFVPHSSNLRQKVELMKNDGFQVIAEVPMENGGGDIKSLGPFALQINENSEKNIANLRSIFSNFIFSEADIQSDKYFTNYLGNKFMGVGNNFQEISKFLQNNNYIFLDDTGFGEKFYNNAGYYKKIDRLINPTIGPSEILLEELKKTLSIADRNGYVIVKTYSRPQMIKAIAEFTQTLPDEYEIVTIDKI